MSYREPGTSQEGDRQFWGKRSRWPWGPTVCVAVLIIVVVGYLLS